MLLAPIARHLGVSSGWGGTWMNALLSILPEGIDVAICTAHPTAPPGRYEVDGRTWFVLRAHKEDLLHRPDERLRKGFRETLERFRPEVIHIHGSEYTYGELALDEAPGIPMVLSIQGLVHKCAEVYWAGLPMRDILWGRTFRDWIRGDGLLEQRIKWRGRGTRERNLLARLAHVIGRTEWDFACLRALNRSAIYHACPEPLRSEFGTVRWSLSQAKRHRIFCPSADYPLKGFHTLLQAAAILRKEFPDLTLRVAGDQRSFDERTPFSMRIREGGYRRILHRKLKELNLSECVSFGGPLDAAGMASAMAEAHAFVLPSYLENSPNSLAEAQFVGTPCIASFVGGIPTGRQEGRDVLFAPAGDAEALAGQIRRVFESDALALTLSDGARRLAENSHCPERIVETLLDIYQRVVSDKEHSQRCAGDRG